MDRKDFMKSLGGLCAGAGILGCGCGRALALGQETQEGTPLSEKYDFAQTYVKRLFDILDSELDAATRTRLVEAMGRACYLGWTEGKTPKTVTVDELAAGIKKRSGDAAIRREGNILYFQYTTGTTGLKVANGYCLCPLVEKGPAGLSGTFCQCSVGYVRTMFSGYLGKPVTVELLESLKRGGKACRFKITIA